MLKERRGTTSAQIIKKGYHNNSTTSLTKYEHFKVDRKNIWLSIVSLVSYCLQVKQFTKISSFLKLFTTSQNRGSWPDLTLADNRPKFVNWERTRLLTKSWNLHRPDTLGRIFFCNSILFNWNFLSWLFHAHVKTRNN